MRTIIVGGALRAALTAASTSLIAATAAPAAAAEAAEGTAVQLEPVQVSGEWLGTASEKEAQVYPGARTVLSPEDIHESGARTLDDALRQAPSVQVFDETGSGILPNIGIRGLNPLRGERVMVLQDGVPLALAPYTGTGLSLFPATLETVERVDVVRGGVAVHHGPNNVGGVINLVTRPIPKDFGGAAKQKAIIAENGNTLFDTYAEAGGFVSPDLGLRAQVNVLTGESFREHSDTDAVNLILDGEWFLSDSAQITGRLHYYQVESELPGALDPVAYEDDRTQSQRPLDAFDAETLRGTVTYTQLIGDDAEFNWMTFGHVADRTFDFGQPFTPSSPATVLASSPREFVVAGTEPRYTWSFDNGTTSQKITVGGRYVREEVDFLVNRTELASGSFTPARDWRFETDALAAYISDTIGFANGRVEVTPGLRYEFVDTDFADRLNDTQEDNIAREFLPGLAIGAEMTDEVFLFANVNRSLRVPQVAQVTRSAEVGSELAWNYEIGARFAPNDALNFSATLFRIDFSDQIEFDRPSQEFRNLGETKHQGIEVTAAWQPPVLPGLMLEGNYTFLDTEQLSGQFAGNDVPFAPEHQAVVQASYEVDQWAFATTGLFRSSAFTDAANTGPETADGAAGEVPASWIWDLQATREVSIDGRPVILAAAINNIFDEDTYFRGVDVSPVGRVPEPGRSFILSAKATF